MMIKTIILGTCTGMQVLITENDDISILLNEGLKIECSVFSDTT